MIFRRPHVGYLEQCNWWRPQGAGSREHYGEFVSGARAVAVAVVLAIVGVWSSIHYFDRVNMRTDQCQKLAYSFAAIVALCMASQLGLSRLGANLKVARLSVLVAGLLAWPIIAGAASFVSQIQEQEAVGPIAN